MRLFLIAFLFLAFSFGASSFAQDIYYTKENRVACILKSDLEKSEKYANAGDRVAWDALINQKKCTVMKAGVKVQVMDTDWSYYEIRPMGIQSTVWTNRKSLTK